MLFKGLAASAALASTVSAHATMYGVWVNGEDQGDGRNVYIRSPENNNPVKDIDIADIVCNVNGGTPVSEFVTAAAGDTLSFEWYHNSRGDDIIDSTHKGPIITYIAAYTEGNGFEPIWTKIDEEGLSGGTWAVDNLIANAGKKDFTLPSDLAAGQYLIRQEIIALHEADVAYSANANRGAQFYPSCVQVEVTGSGTAIPDENFDFDTGYTYEDPGIVFNVYGDATSYEIPGPEVWTGAGGSGSGDASTTAAAPTSAVSSAAPTAETSAESSAAPTEATSVATSAVPSQTPTTLITATRAPTTTAAPTSAPAPSETGSVGAQSLYGQCGGNNWTGATGCASGTCTAWNEWYYQCVPN
ncbi:glycosyl hydrolase family 61-domain-containing protein [Xylariomycetidae sp. FL2044]|nr:glycosyl hydrolase family 61-domain-containing protein [Xylariomycetidae sp. FL2044]